MATFWLENSFVTVFQDPTFLRPMALLAMLFFSQMVSEVLSTYSFNIFSRYSIGLSDYEASALFQGLTAFGKSIS